jgi:multisubunit Na+/H+ antiporter MnhC subunit
MQVLISLVIAVLVGTGVWLLLSRRLLRLVLGLGLITHAVNLFLFVCGRLSMGGPAFAPGGVQPPAGHADPLPQALILTAIVIGFGATAFLLALAARAQRVLGDDQHTAWRRAEPRDDAHAAATTPPAGGHP